MKTSSITRRTLLLATAVVLTLTRLASAQDTQRNYRLDTGFNHVLEGEIHAIAVQPDGKVLIAGGFEEIDGASNRVVARLNPDGSLDPSFHSGITAAVYINAMALQANGQIVVGGLFDPGPDGLLHNVARLNADGSLDPGFSATTAGLNEQVNYVCVQADGKVIVSGEFLTVNGTPGFPGFARLNPDGSVDTEYMSAVSAFIGFDLAVCLQSDGKLLINTVRVGSSSLARLNSDGTLDRSFLPGTKPDDSLILNGRLSAIAQQVDGKILLLGHFTGVAGVPSANIARLNADGTVDTTFAANVSGSDPSVGVTGSIVTTAAVQTDGKIVIGGGFDTVSGVAAANVARLRADGTFDPSFIANASAQIGSFVVQAVAVQADGKVVAGGRFERVNGVARLNLARFNVDPTITIEALNGNISDADLAQGSFRLNRTGDGLGSLTVNFLIRGGALNGTDYTIKNIEAGATTGKKKFKAGKFSKPIHVTPVNTGTGSGGLKGVKIKLVPGDGYIVGDPAVAKFKIVDE